MCICSHLQLSDLLMCPPGNNSNGSSSQLSSPQDTKRNMVTRQIEALIVYTKGQCTENGKNLSLLIIRFSKNNLFIVME